MHKRVKHLGATTVTQTCSLSLRPQWRSACRTPSQSKRLHTCMGTHMEWIKVMGGSGRAPVARRRLQSRGTPAPMAGPLINAMVGIGSLRMDRKRS